MYRRPVESIPCRKLWLVRQYCVISSTLSPIPDIEQFANQSKRYAALKLHIHGCRHPRVKHFRDNGKSHLDASYKALLCF